MGGPQPQWRRRMLSLAATYRLLHLHRFATAHSNRSLQAPLHGKLAL